MKRSYGCRHGALLPDDIPSAIEVCSAVAIRSMFAEAWSEHLVQVGVLLAILSIGVIISARTFRWE